MGWIEWLGVLAFILAFVAVIIAVLQVREAQRVTTVQAEIGALSAFLSVELAGVFNGLCLSYGG